MKYFITTMLLVLNQAIFSQHIVEGTIVDQKREPLAFVNISLLNIVDSSSLKYGSISDFSGHFIIEGVLEDGLLIKVSMIGYGTYFDSLNLKESDYNEIIVLSPSVSNLQEVIIEGSSMVNDINKTTYFISKIERKKASSSLDLMGVLPQVRVDYSSNRVLSMDGKAVFILINGLRASAQELIAINPGEIQKVEYYDIPPARYTNTNYCSVINVIAKQITDGIDLVLDLENALFTGFGNDLLSFKYNKKNTQISFFYNLSYRNYTEKLTNEASQYFINEENIKTERIGIKSPFSYVQNIIGVNLVFNKDSSYTFGLKLSPNFTSGNYETRYNIRKEINDIEINGVGHKDSEFEELAPSLNLNFSKILSKNQIFKFDITGNYFSNNNNYYRNEISTIDDTILNDRLLNSSEKRSIYIESLYEKHLKKLDISIGARFIKGFFMQKTKNSLGNNDYSMETSENYFYTEAIGKIKNISCQVSLGLNYNTYSENNTSNKYSFISFRPLIRLNFPINKHAVIKTLYRITPHNPTLSQLSLNTYLLDNFIIYSGNPELIPYQSHNLSIDFSYNISRFYLSSQFQFSNSIDPIVSEYTYEDDFILSSYRNQGWKKEFVLSFSMKHNPFKSNWFQYTLYSAIFNFQNHYNSGYSNTVTDFIVYASFDLNYRNLTLKFNFQNDYRQLEGQTISTASFDSRSSLQYKYKQWSFIIGMWNPISKSIYTDSKNVSSSIVYDKSSVDIFDNGQMLYLKLHYNLNFGLRFKKNANSNSNSDSDSGAFRIN